MQSAPTFRTACCAMVIAAVCLSVLGCGDDVGPTGAGPAGPDLTWRPTVTDPGTDLFAWDDPDARTGASPAAESAIRTVLADLDTAALGGKVTVDYPFEETLFPPEMCAPTFLWHDGDNRVNAWLIDAAFDGGTEHIYAVTSGRRTQREIDPRCVTETNTWAEPPYEASAKAWTPDARTWDIFKQRSLGGRAVVTVYGLVGTGGARGTRTVVSRGSVTVSTSTDPVGAQVFYRDVPLMPSQTEDGLIKPLVTSALPLIAWRLRDLSARESKIVMRDMPTCGNCHSFSQDGKTLAMDMDGPEGDKGAHVVKTVSPHMVIEDKDVFTWNSFGNDPAGPQSFGLFPQVSPDGRYVVATVHEAVYVQNYMDWRFLQTFYPTRGILAFFNRDTREIRALPGAADVRYVQSNACWTPDGTELIFIRAEAKAAYNPGERSKYANDPMETQIRYDLYRIAFNGGRGGVPRPIPGASANGMSNAFPKVSPDGKWIVFVGCRNGLLMRPDSKLYIMPAAGGAPKEMRCNTPRMNSWHSWSPNSRWLVFSSKWPSPYTQMYLTHIDAEGNASPPVLVPDSTAANRAVNLPEFAAIAPGGLVDITTPASDYRRHIDRAKKLEEAGRVDEAFVEIRKSLELRDDFATTHFTLGNLLVKQGKMAEAVPSFRRAVTLDPQHRQALNNLGFALTQLGKPEEGLPYLDRSLRLNREQASTQINVGITLARLGRIDEANEHFAVAIRLEPDSARGQYEWATALVRTNRFAEAATHFAEAVRLNPRYAEAQHDWGTALALLGKTAEAIEHFNKALEINPRFALAHESLGTALNRLKRYAEAVAHYRKAIELHPGSDSARNNLAWTLATVPDATVRDGAEALRHAEIVCRNTGRKNPMFLVTLAAALAEVGRFEEAVRTVEEARDIARAARAEALAKQIEFLIDLFKAHKPMRLEP